MSAIQIINPYRFAGSFHKAQLHLHTSESIDVLKKIPLNQTVRRYQEAGYNFIVITDHDRCTQFHSPDNPDFIVIPGTEETVVAGLWPLGKHLIKIGCSGKNPNKKNNEESILHDGLIMPAHPNWPGNFWTGRWRFDELKQMPNFRLLEIYNRHSPSEQDVKLWHQLLVERGVAEPLWGVAVDDTDNATPLDLGWIMVKTPEVSRKAFMNAIFQGSFYATCGPVLDFTVNDNMIQVSTQSDSITRFINASDSVVLDKKTNFAEYRPQSGDSFIRIEVLDGNGKKAWSQPFFIIDTQ